MSDPVHHPVQPERSGAESRGILPKEVAGPALAVIELGSIARGYVVADALLKRARIQIGMAEPITPGKFVLVFTGAVAEVEESFKAGLEAAATTLLDQLLLSQVARPLVLGLQGHFHQKPEESLGFVETQTIASAIRSADAACKRADVFLTHLHLAKGIGGKGYYGLAGSLHMVEAALEAAAAAIEPTLLVTTEIIQRPHAELKVRL